MDYKYSMIAVSELYNKIRTILTKLNVPDAYIKVLTDYIITVERMGLSTHGVEYLLQLVPKIQKKHFSYKSDKPIISNNNFHLFDSQNNIGVISAMNAVKTGIKFSKDFGTHIVFVRNSNTFGAASYYGFRAAEEGMVLICLSNSPASIRLKNSSHNLIGTNPLSITIPSKNANHLILDMAMSKVAKSKLREYLISGKKVPTGWGLDENGNNSNDAREILGGSLLPFGGYKSLGLAIVVDLISGLLTGSSYLNNVNKWLSDKSEMNVGQAFIFINPRLVFGDSFYDEFENYKNLILDSSLDSNGVRIPGLRTMKSYNSNINKITIPTSTFNKLNELFNTLDG